MRSRLVALAALAAALALPLRAQVLASEKASVSQTVNGATVTVE